MVEATCAIARQGMAILCLALLLSGCAGLRSVNQHRAGESSLDYRPVSGPQNILARFAPRFEVENAAAAYNRIGTPVAVPRPGDHPRIVIDTDRPAIFAEEQSVVTARGRYRNLIYRVHFPGIPFSLIPFHLTAGSSAGLLAILTLDAEEKPLLVSVVHTCGCFLAMVPTSYLDSAAFPPRWDPNGQSVFGVSLPGLLDYGTSEHPERRRLVISVRSGTHRVVDVRLASDRDAEGDGSGQVREMPIRPMAALERLPYAGGEISLFETHGPRRGYVRNSVKPLEALLMGWWALDPYVGEDKALGPREKTGVTFYTSLKIAAREASDLGDFATFLRYWGWGL